MNENKPICIREVNENIRRVETGQPLTRSLRVLNSFCEFRKKFNEFDRRFVGLNKVDKAREKAYREANKDKIKAYREANKDKIKAYREANKDKIAKRGKAYREANKKLKPKNARSLGKCKIT